MMYFTKRAWNFETTPAQFVREFTKQQSVSEVANTEIQRVNTGTESMTSQVHVLHSPPGRKCLEVDQKDLKTSTYEELWGWVKSYDTKFRWMNMVTAPVGRPRFLRFSEMTLILV